MDEMSDELAPAAKSSTWLEAHLNRAIDAQIAYGKWILNSLLLVSGGAVLAITQSGDRAYELLAASGYSLVAAVVFSLVAGGLAWLNWTAASIIYVKLLRDPGRTTSARSLRVVRWTTAGSILFVLLAIGSLVCAARQIVNVLPEASLLERLLG